MNEYPVGSFGYEHDRLLREVEALPWWCWFVKRSMRRQLEACRRRMETARDAFLGELTSAEGDV